MARDAGIPLTNLARMTCALSRGLSLPVQVDGTRQVGFAVRIDDAPFGPVAVVHVPEGRFIRVLYRDPDELTLITPDDTVRVQ
ncbi:MAG: hypothetical protein K0R39_2837 [Symbiobacteriaceae bacterium]|jgi:hypothetical protein|nr:hypothetical protein [Symbiobacteriaceae bacterium]